MFAWLSFLSDPILISIDYCFELFMKQKKNVAIPAI